MQHLSRSDMMLRFDQGSMIQGLHRQNRRNVHSDQLRNLISHAEDRRHDMSLGTSEMEAAASQGSGMTVGSNGRQNLPTVNELASHTQDTQQMDLEHLSDSGKASGGANRLKYQAYQKARKIGGRGFQPAAEVHTPGRERDVDSIEGSLAALFLDAVSGPGGKLDDQVRQKANHAMRTASMVSVFFTSQPLATVMGFLRVQGVMACVMVLIWVGAVCPAVYYADRGRVRLESVRVEAKELFGMASVDRSGFEGIRLYKDGCRIIETLPPQQLETAAELFIEWQQPVEFNGWKLLLPAQQTPGEVARFAAWGVREGEEDESCLLRQHRGACEMEVADSVDEEEGERTVLVDLRPTAGQWISWVVLPIFQGLPYLFAFVFGLLHRESQLVWGCAGAQIALGVLLLVVSGLLYPSEGAWKWWIPQALIYIVFGVLLLLQQRWMVRLQLSTSSVNLVLLFAATWQREPWYWVVLRMLGDLCLVLSCVVIYLQRSLVLNRAGKLIEEDMARYDDLWNQLQNWESEQESLLKLEASVLKIQELTRQSGHGAGPPRQKLPGKMRSRASNVTSSVSLCHEQSLFAADGAVLSMVCRPSGASDGTGDGSLLPRTYANGANGANGTNGFGSPPLTSPENGKGGPANGGLSPANGDRSPANGGPSPTGASVALVPVQTPSNRPPLNGTHGDGGWNGASVNGGSRTRNGSGDTPFSGIYRAASDGSGRGLVLMAPHGPSGVDSNGGASYDGYGTNVSSLATNSQPYASAIPGGRYGSTPVLTPIRSLDQVYAQARIMHVVMKEKVKTWALASRAMIRSSSGGFMRYVDAAGDADLERQLRWGQVKSTSRAIQKQLRNYSGDPSRLVDVCRQALVFESIAELHTCVETIMADSEVRLVRVKNRLDHEFDASASLGYRDVALNLQIHNQFTTSLCVNHHVCELQLVPYVFAKVKSTEGHHRYVKFRDQRAE